MHAARWIALGLSTLLIACPKDDSSDDGATLSTTIDPSTSTTPAESSSGPAESSGAVTESSSGVVESSGPGDTSTGGACPAGSECMDDTMCPGGGMCLGCLCVGGNQCDPIVPGEWNSCVGKDGNTDNTLCNWMGSGGATGFIGCLNSAEADGSNVCFISGCKDVCDCFAPPATGTAEVICGEILADGGTGCALDCGAGQICPDGMVCQGTTCFWPPA